jgi:hypothetical protein
MNTSLLLSLALVGLFLGFAQAETQVTSTPDTATGIEGTISLSPVQGGPVRQGSPDSKPLANMAFEVKQGDRVITSFQTNDQGYFRVSLKSGHYTISRKDWKAAIGSYGPFEVDVSQGKMTEVRWNCDTGLR